jgi:hypothetical protein
VQVVLRRSILLIMAGNAALASLKNGSVERLDLYNKYLDEATIIKIADALRTDEKVTAVDLSGNHITDACASRLAEVLLVNTTITAMDLGGSRLSDWALQSLAVALESNRSLVALGLCNTNVTDLGADHLAKAIEINATLTCANLSRTRVSSTMKNRIEDAAQANSCSFPICLQATTTTSGLLITCLNLGGSEVASLEVASSDIVAAVVDNLRKCGNFRKGTHKFVLPNGQLLEKCRPSEIISNVLSS